MKTNHLLLITLLLSSWCQAQVEVMILGTVHHFDEEFKSLQNFEKIQSDIISYDPDIICIEAIPIDDTLSLKEIWPKNMRRADRLKVALKAGNYGGNATCSQLEGAQYFSNYDFWNAYYLWDSIGTDNSPGPFAQYHRNLANSEYGNIVYPAARKLKIDKFHNIDYRYQEKEFLETNNKVLKKLLFKFKLKPIKSYLKIQKQYRKEHKNGTLIEFVNGPEFQNSFANLIDSLPAKLKKSQEAKFVKEAWHLRNKIMAGRIQQIAKSNNATKVLVTVGAAHVTHIKYYLEKSGLSVMTYPEFLNQSNQSK